MRILLVKLSSLGDVVHTLPVVQDIKAALPDAQIDWVVEKAFAPLLGQVAGLHRVIACELRRWRKSFWATQTRSEWQAFKSQLQRDPYDAVIDLQGLTKSAIVARLARLTPGGKRYAMANKTDGSGYEAPTRWAADVAVELAPHVHAVQRGRTLAAQALGYRCPVVAKYGLNYCINSRETPVFNGSDDINNIAKQFIFIHGTSRQDKEWPVANWVALGQRFAARGYQVRLVHGNPAEQVTSHTIAAQIAGSVVLPLLPLDELMSELGRCTGAIGVDSGVSHIAVALDLPHVQIYNFDTAWRTGPVDCRHQTSVYAAPCPAVEAVWQAWLTCESAVP